MSVILHLRIKEKHTHCIPSTKRLEAPGESALAFWAGNCCWKTLKPTDFKSVYFHLKKIHRKILMHNSFLEITSNPPKEAQDGNPECPNYVTMKFRTHYGEFGAQKMTSEYPTWPKTGPSFISFCFLLCFSGGPDPRSARGGVVETHFV